MLCLLNGHGPGWLLNPEIYARDKSEFIVSYKRLMPVINKIAHREMLAHRFLTDDRLVQQRTFTGGITVIINLRESGDYVTLSGTTVKALGFLAQGETAEHDATVDADKPRR